MDRDFLQDVQNDILVQGVDTNQKTFIVLPYEQAVAQGIPYIMIVGLFIYKDSVLIKKNQEGLWDVTIELPLLYGSTHVTLLERAMFEQFDIQGVHCVQKRYLSPTLLQPYFLYVYELYIPYKTHISIDVEIRRFIDIALLKQSVLLEPSFFTPLLIQNIDIV